MKNSEIKKSETKIFAFVVMLIVFTTGVNAQTRIGLATGLNYSNQNSNVENWEHAAKMNTTSGLFVEFEFNRNFSLKTQLNLAGKGSSITDVNTENLVYEFKNKYLEMPVMAKYSTGEKVRPFVQAGTYIAVLTNSRLGGHYGAKSLRADLKRVTQTVDAGLCTGVGIDYIIKGITFSAEANWKHGLMNTLQAGTIKIEVGDDTANGTINGIDVSKNRDFQIVFGISVPLSK